MFDRLVVNPKRGVMDFYTKAWPVVVGGFIALSMASAALKPPVAAYGGTGAGTTTNSPVYATYAPNAHACWEDPAGELVGCTMSNGRVVGVSNGTPVTCYYTDDEFARENTVTCDR